MHKVPGLAHRTSSADSTIHQEKGSIKRRLTSLCQLNPREVLVQINKDPDPAGEMASEGPQNDWMCLEGSRNSEGRGRSNRIKMRRRGKDISGRRNDLNKGKEMGKCEEDL